MEGKPPDKVWIPSVRCQTQKKEHLKCELWEMDQYSDTFFAVGICGEQESGCVLLEDWTSSRVRRMNRVTRWMESIAESLRDGGDTHETTSGSRAVEVKREWLGTFVLSKQRGILTTWCDLC